MSERASRGAAAFHAGRDGDLVWIQGAVEDNRVHRHQALQVSWSAPGADACVRSDDRDYRGACVVVDRATPHRLVSSSGLICLVDPASAVARRIRRTFLLRESVDLAARVVVVEGSTWDGRRSARTQLESLVGRVSGDVADPRIARTLSWLDTMEEQRCWAEVGLAAALQLTHLSRSRFLHLFSQEVGAPWRSYLVWRRALVAIASASRGSLLTQAAHEAGYADAAHLTRQFKALFGFTPSAVLEAGHLV